MHENPKEDEMKLNKLFLRWIAFFWLLAVSAHAAVSITSSTVGGGSSVTVAPSATISANVAVTLTSGTRWRSTSWRIGSSGWYTCVDHSNHDSNGNYNETFNITAPNTTGTYDVTFIAYTNSSCDSSTFDTEVMSNAVTVSAPEINVVGITDNGTDTSFGSALVSGGTIDKTYTIENTGTNSLSITGVTFSGGNSGDFSVLSAPAASVVVGSSTTFTVRFDPSAAGNRTTTLNIANNDSNENPYNFTISGTGYIPAPEINVQGNGNNITDGDNTPSTTDNTDFGIINVNGGIIEKTFRIQNTGTAALNVSGVSFNGGNAAEFSVITAPAASIAIGAYSDFTVRFTAPATEGTRTTEMIIASDDGNEAAYDIDIRATSVATNANNDSYTTGISMTLSVNTASGLLANDTGYNKRVVSNTAPSHGTLTVNTDGSFVYTPTASYIGNDTFNYTITSDDGQTDTATVSVTIDTLYDGLHSFDRINPDSTRYVRGNYKIAGNTVTCLTSSTSGYGYEVNGSAKECQDAGYETITSNDRVNRYIDIDSDASTWNSSSSYINFPSTFDSSAGRGVLWAGLFWQGRIAWRDDDDSDYSIRYAKVNGSTYNYTETHNVDSVNIYDTDAKTIKLKINNGSYNNIQASTFYSSTSDDGTTYAAFSDVTEILKNASLDDGKQVFTVANLTTAEGREANPGLFGGWSLVVIYAEDVDGKTRNINVYNGLDLLTSGSSNPAFPISGLKLPTTGEVRATLSLFSGEGEYKYGYRPDNTDNYDWVKLSDDDTTYDYMPGAITNDNIFDGKLSGVLRDTVTGKYNSLSINNNGVDVDTYDVSTLVTGYRDANPDLDHMYIKWDSDEDYITPSMLAFATELYEPRLCYDYTLKQDGRYLTVDRTDPVARINQPISSSPIDILVYLRNKEADIPANGISVKADVNATRFGYTMTNPMYVSNPNGSALIDRGVPASNFPTNCTYSLSSGNGVANQGCVAFIENNAATTLDDIRRIRKGAGTLGSEEYIYTKFTINPQEISGTFNDINESLGLTLDYYISIGSTTIPYYDYVLGGPNVQMCTPSNVYAPAWGQFNVVESKTEPNFEPSNNIKTQISRRPFNVDVAFDSDPSTGTNDAPTSNINTTVMVEMIDVDSFGDINASCANPDAGVSAPIVVPLTMTSTDNTDPVPAQNESYHNFALKNGAFRVWYFTDSDGNLIQNWTASTSDQGKTVNSISGLFNSVSHGDCNSSCGVSGGSATSPGCFTCMKEYYGKPLCSRDNFSVRPEAFDIRIKDFPNPVDLVTNTDLTHDVYGYAPDTTPTLGRMNLAAGYDYRYDLTATGNETNSSAFVPVPRYTKYFNGANPDYNITMYWDSALTATECNDISNRSVTAYLVNGVRQNQTNLQNQVGDYRLNMTDKSWTAVDQISANANRTALRGFDITTDCVLNSNSTQIDASGEYGCEISSSHTNGGLVYKDHNLTLKPAKFDLSSFTYGLGKNAQPIVGGQGFVYMSDLNKSNDMNMSVRSTGQIRAVGANDLVLSNFVGGCFAKDLNISLEHDANLSYTTPFVARMVNSTLGGVQSYDTEEIVLTGSTITSIDDSNFTKIDSGALTNVLRFNFDRNQTTMHNPQTVAYGDINVSCTLQADCNSSSMRNLPISNTAVGTTAINASITHVYGKLKTNSVRVMGLIPFSTIAQYEIYNSPALLGTAMTVDSQDGNWSINALHTETTYGDATVPFVVPTAGSQPVGANSYANGVETYNFPAFTVRQGYRAHIDTEGWLWYGAGMNEYTDPNNPGNVDCTTHPCFDISFGRIIGNTGSAKTESETQKANKNTTSGTGWNSTSEYAPAIR